MMINHKKLNIILVLYVLMLYYIFRRFDLIHGSYYFSYYLICRKSDNSHGLMGNILDIIFINLKVFWKE
jgi:hypothetical protein